MVPYAAKNTHCSFCGAYFINQGSFPKKCVVCDNTTYSNPLPVSVSLIRASTNGCIGILLVQRNVEPQAGAWALPGGYLETGETWSEGAAREVREETGILLDPERIKCYGVANASTTSSLLIFNTYDDVIDWDKFNFTPNREVSDLDLCFIPTELAFPSHTTYLKKYLQELTGDNYGV
jgi:8-oxo-dGTP pyrophosphatase MutT (NUDIX family)